jgi:hypothetical protein
MERAARSRDGLQSGSMREDLQPGRAPVVLRPSKRKELALLAVSLGFAVLGAFAAASGEAIGWAALVFFGLCAVVAVVTLLPGASYLRLEPEGFVMCSLYRADRLRRWDEVTGFHVYSTPGGAQVGFDFSPGARPPGSGLARGLAGVDGGLPNTYGLKAEELAELLSLWRETYSRSARR